MHIGRFVRLAPLCGLALALSAGWASPAFAQAPDEAEVGDKDKKGGDGAQAESIETDLGPRYVPEPGLTPEPKPKVDPNKKKPTKGKEKTAPGAAKKKAPQKAGAKAAPTKAKDPKGAKAKGAKAKDGKAKPAGKKSASEGAVKKPGEKAKKPAPADEPSWFARNFPLSLNDHLHPSVDEGWYWFFVGGLLGLVGGQVWLPMLLLDDDPPEDYLWTTFWIMLYHGLFQALGAVPFVILTIIALIIAVIVFIPPVIGWVLLAVWLAISLPVIGVLSTLVNVPCCLVNQLYCTPAATANEWSYLAWTQKGGKKKQKKEEKKRKPFERLEAHNPPPSRPAVAMSY